MAESEPSRALHDGSLTSKASGAALGFSLAREVAPTLTPMALHGYTLQFLIAVIKNSNRKIDPRA
jgi:hypothetical protein